MRVAALIIGIDGWHEYTRPLLESIKTHEPDCMSFVIDNASANQYPPLRRVRRTERLCYSAAINEAQRLAAAWMHDDALGFDWYIVLSNDVLCTGPFVEILSQLPTVAIAGPCLKETHGYQYLEGWCVCVPAAIWDELGGWDEQFQVSSWEDVDFTQSAIEAGCDVVYDGSLPFVHLDQRQRFHLVPDYWSSERHNIDYFLEKRKAAQ